MCKLIPLLYTENVLLYDYKRTLTNNSYTSIMTSCDRATYRCSRILL